MAYVYRHIRKDKNQPFYIGIGTDKNYSRANTIQRRNQLWNRVYNKTEIEVEILIDDIVLEAAREKEIEFIALYKRINDGGMLTNITLGGEGVTGYKNYKLSERNRAGLWIGKKHKAESIDKIRKAITGLKRTEETKERIKKAKHGMHYGTKNPNYKGKVLAYKNGELIGEFESASEAAIKLNCSNEKISNVLNGKRKMHHGYFFQRISINKAA